MRKTKKIQKEINEDIKYTIKDLNMDDIIPNTFDDFIVTIYEGHHTIMLPSHITGMQFKIWSRGRGGIFSKDVLNHSLNVNKAKYILLKTDVNTCIARLIDEEELTMFESLNLVDGQIKDIPYMIVRYLNEGDQLTNAKRRTSENEMIYEEASAIIHAVKSTHTDDVDYHVSSVSLFTDN